MTCAASATISGLRERRIIASPPSANSTAAVAIVVRGHRALQAVSYTHLDVYKRQAREHPRRAHGNVAHEPHEEHIDPARCGPEYLHAIQAAASYGRKASRAFKAQICGQNAGSASGIYSGVTQFSQTVRNCAVRSHQGHGHRHHDAKGRCV